MSKPPPTKVFICYKKLLGKAKAGSKISQENTYAATIAEILNQSQDGFVVWLDESDMPGGIEWEQTIFTNLRESDVVLVVILPGTSLSDWVKREITVAKAFGISVYPLGVGMTMNQLTSELTSLGIVDLQGKISQNVKLTARDALLAEIGRQLKEAAQRTRDVQPPMLKKALDRFIPPKAADAQWAASFGLPRHGGMLNLYVAAGDVGRVRDIDVLVSSENDYMQMARFFESRTVSSTLRLRGAELGGHFDDAIQTEIDLHLKQRFRPLQAGDCVITSAGGPHSDLVSDNRAKYIVHVVAVQTVIAEARVTPFSQPNQIVKCVRGALLNIGRINQNKGIVSPKDTARHQSQEQDKDKYVPVRSVLFPLFGTGQGGAGKREVIELMLNSLLDFVNDPTDWERINGLTDIYLSAFLEPDVQQVTDLLGKRLVRLA